jgi:ATPase
VRDFESQAIEYEIYTYGEENVVVPISELKTSAQSDNVIKKLAESKIKDTIRRFDPDADINIISDNRVQVKVSKDVIARIIGKGGSTVSELERILGMKIDVEVKTPTLGKELDFEVSEAGSTVNISVDESAIGKKIDVYVEDELVLNSQIGKKSRIKIDKRSENGKKIINALLAGNKIRIFLSKD